MNVTQIFYRKQSVESQLWILSLLIVLSAIAPLAVDMFLPAMPSMASELDISSTTLQLCVTLFLLAFAGSQLIYGPCSDRFGRRPVMTGGLFLFILGGIVCVLANGPTMLIVGRVIQGFGGGAGAAISRAIVLDHYGKESAARALSYINVATPLAPMLAPIIGGLLLEVFDWQAVFFALILLGVMLLIGYRVSFSETNRYQDSTALTYDSILKNLGTLFSTRDFVVYSTTIGFMFSAQLIFISSSSFVLIDEFGLSPRNFGFSFGLMAFGIMLGAWTASRSIGRIRTRRLVLIGTGIGMLGGATMVAFTLTGMSNVWTIVLPMTATAFGFGFARPAAMAAAMIPFPQIAGMASAILGFVQMLGASFYNVGYGSLFSPDAVNLSVAIAIAAFVAFMNILILRPDGDS